MPSGTKSNLCALMAHCERGDEYIVGQMAHTYRREGGGAAVLGSIQPQPLAQPPDGIAPAGRRRRRDQAPKTSTRAAGSSGLENTMGAGSVLPLRLHREPPPRWPARRGLATHLDGARLFNAAVASAASAGDARAAAHHRRHFDTVSVCFSKGLGAPVGSALVAARGLHRPGPPHPQDGRRRHAPGRRPRRRARCTPWTTTSTAWPKTTPTPARWRTGCRACRA